MSEGSSEGAADHGLVVGTATENHKDVEEDGDDVQVDDQSSKDVFLRIQGVLLPPHHQLAVHRKKLQVKSGHVGLMTFQPDTLYTLK